ncbi:MAG: hypothetical protein ACYS0H_01065 [Planctomycetota bacterium]|jgi:hypothetical protein
MKRFSLVLFITLLPARSTLAGPVKDAELTSLAVFVTHEPDAADFAGKLRPLLEAEASMQWPGQLVERMRLERLLDELKISVSGLAEPDESNLAGRLRSGKLVPVDCLLSARVESNAVRVTVTLFPSTAVICERTYDRRIHPHSLAVNTVTDALRVFRQHNCDPNVPQISVGSFYCADPHRRFFEFSRDIDSRLRQRLVETRDIIVTERLLPSRLLSEFELSRAGFTEQVARCLSAPPSDILLFGEFQPKSEQELQSKAAVLDHTLFVLSPTGLCKNRQVEFSCLSNDPETVTRRAVKLIEQATDEVRNRLAAGEKRSFSQQEFEAFKKQAFRLMPSRPDEDGDFYKRGHYRGPTQFAPSSELTRVLHMLECAILFRSDDTQTLVCTGAILEGLARCKNDYPGSARDGLRHAGLDLIERAYFLDSNWNTRGMYWRFCLHGGLVPAERRPARCLDAARQIWDTRHTEPWHPHETRSAFSILFESQSELRHQYGMFLEAAGEYESEKDGLRDLFNLFSHLRRRILSSNGDPAIIEQGRDVADGLLAEQSIFLRALGRLLHLTICFEIGETRRNAVIPAECIEHFHDALNMLPGLYEHYGREFANCSYSYRLREFLSIYEKTLREHNLPDDTAWWREQYITVQMKAGNHNGSSIIQVFRNLLDVIWEQRRYERADELITEFLGHYTVGGSGDYDRMWLARQRNRFISAMLGETMPGTDRLEKVDFDDDNTGWVTKVTASGDDIFGVRSNQWFQNRNGVAFRMACQTRQANVLRQITGDVSDVACAGGFVAFATSDGLHLLNRDSGESRHLTIQNSGLPGQRASMVCDYNDGFYIGFRDKEGLYTLIYHLDPDAGRISSTDTKFSAHSYWRMKSNALGSSESVVVPQTWHHRTAIADGKSLEFLCDKYGAIKNVAVRSTEDCLLLSYRGFELSYVFDFTLWQGNLIFATGNGLYASKPGSNEIRCILCEPDLLFFSLCPVDDKMYIGTSDGLYYLRQETIDKMR